MADTRGCWSLSEAWAEKAADEWVGLPSVWLPAPPLDPDTADTAYWATLGGGGDECFKIPVPSDTWAKIPGGTGSINAGDTTGSQTLGFLSGGYSYSWYKKVTYSTDTIATAHPGGGNAYKNYDNTAITDGDNGYWLGGERVPGGAALSSSEKVTYATATVSAGANLPGTRAGFLGSTGSTTTGYMCGAATPSRKSDMLKLVYSTSTMSGVPGADYPAPTGSGDQSATGVTDTHGYFVGGYSPAGASSINCKLTYSSETFAREPGGNLPRSSYYLSTTGSRTVGYWGGGESTGSPNPIKNSNVHKLTYSNSTFANVPSSIQFNPNTWGEKARGFGPRKGGVPATGSAKRWFDGGSPNDGGYVVGGVDPSGNATSTDKITYSTGTVSASSNMNSARYMSTSLTTPASLSRGYAVSGGPGPAKPTAEKFPYSDETYTLLPGSLINEGSKGGTGTNSTTAGYISGGEPGPSMGSKTGKMTFSSETWVYVPGANLTNSIADNSDGGFSNAPTAGYMGGGQMPGYPSGRTIVDKLTFATDTTARIPSADLALARIFVTGAGGPTFGYFYGGGPSGSRKTTVDKITYATDARTNDNMVDTYVPVQCAGIGGNEKASFAGGRTPSSSSAVNQIDFSTGTASLMPGTMGSTKFNTSGFSATADTIPMAGPPVATPTASTTNSGIPENGYIAGGYGNVSSISKLDMASETYTRLTTSLSETNRRLTGFGNLTQGYATGGTQPVRTSCQKFVYSTTTRTTLPSTLTASRGYIGSIGNNTAGYVGGGTPHGSYGTKLDKMPYSNETFSALPSLPGSRYRYGTLGNQTQGYFAGGYPNQMSLVKKITYSNDSYASNPNLSYSATFQTGAGNATKGYVVSGEGGGTKVDRVTFSNDTTARVPSANLSAVRYSMEANNTPTKAYFTGGSPGVKTNTEVITFSNDTATLSTTANADTGDNQAGAYAAFGPNHCGNPGSDIQPNVI